MTLIDDSQGILDSRQRFGVSINDGIDACFPECRQDGSKALSYQYQRISDRLTLAYLEEEFGSIGIIKVQTKYEQIYLGKFWVTY